MQEWEKATNQDTPVDADMDSDSKDQNSHLEELQTAQKLIASLMDKVRLLEASAKTNKSQVTEEDSGSQEAGEELMYVPIPRFEYTDYTASIDMLPGFMPGSKEQFLACSNLHDLLAQWSSMGANIPLF